MSTDFLVELGTEELPPKALKKLSAAFSAGIIKGLKEQKLEFGAVKSYATPRRLALVVEQLAEQTPVKEVVAWGPPAKIAFDADGNPSKAAEAFARKNSLDVSDLKIESDGKIDKLCHRASAGGVNTAELLGAIVNASVKALPIAKRMRWGASRTEFVRPAHWLIMLLGNEVVDAEVLGIKANRVTRGHRFHYNQDLIIDSPASYAEQLRAPGHIIADYAERQAMVEEQVIAEAKNVGGIAVISQDLLDEVTALVEYPVALTGKFEQRFLDVPAEALISSMAEHQKYFHVVDGSGNLKSNFITVANIISTDPAQVIDGNERVIRPRLADAAFFFETDKKSNLSAMRERLQKIVFQAKLGTIYDKTERVSKLAANIAELIGGNADYAARAGLLCKSDLVSEMVCEFDKMQGIAGRYYALNDGEPAEVAEALAEQYLPKFSGDKLPETLTGTLVALSDRLDTIVGIFGIGQKPTGSKDPFALRRASLGALRLLVEKELDLDLSDLLLLAAKGHADNIETADTAASESLAYMLERFRAWYLDENISAEVFQAVSAKQLTTPLDINKRVHAVNAFTQLPEAQALAAANKRVSNILGKLEGEAPSNLDSGLLQENAEKALAEQVASKSLEVAPLFAERRYAEALAALASLQGTIDTFFDDVMVMCDDLALRNNRLALLAQLRGLFLEAADISLLVPEKKK
jgi:glycyl-tRNA synthetase beta chain